MAVTRLNRPSTQKRRYNITPPFTPPPQNSIKYEHTVPTDTGTYDIPEHFCLILERVVLVPE